MYAAAIFDTFAAVKKLPTAGIATAYAEAVVETIKDSVPSQLATKTDLQLEIHKLKIAMMPWGIGLSLFIIAAVGFLLKF